MESATSALVAMRHASCAMNGFRRPPVDVVKGTMLEPLTAHAKAERPFDDVWAYPDVPDEEWNFIRPILQRRIKTLEDRCKISSGYVS